MNSLTREIPLGKSGLVTLVDAEDYDLLMNWKWYAAKRYDKRGLIYVKRREKIACKYQFISLHRVIMNCPDGLVVDHINGNTLDNRKENLRICTSQQNVVNQRRRIPTKSGYIGVREITRKGPTGTSKRWVAEISRWVNGKRKRLYQAYFDSPQAAALAYNQAAEKLHGEFAKRNDVKPEDVPIKPKRIWNKHGFAGVEHRPSHTESPWKSCIVVKGKKIHLGSFATPQEAEAIYLAAREQYYRK